MGIKAGDAGLLAESLDYGSPDDARALLEEIVARESTLGDALADGVDAASARLGGDDLLPTVKAMELPAYDPRGARSMALAYATSDRGACHRRALPIEREGFDGNWGPERAAAAVICERTSVRCCGVSSWTTSSATRSTTSALSGLMQSDWTRTATLRQSASGSGHSRACSTSAKASRGPTTTCRPRSKSRSTRARRGRGNRHRLLDAMLDEYYRQRGWDADGHPTPETIERLGLADAVDQSTLPADTAPEYADEIDPMYRRTGRRRDAEPGDRRARRRAGETADYRATGNVRPDSDAEAGVPLQPKYESRRGHDAERNSGETASADPGGQAVPHVPRETRTSRSAFRRTAAARAAQPRLTLTRPRTSPRTPLLARRLSKRAVRTAAVSTT